MAILTESQVASLKDEIRQQVKAAFEDKITDYIVGGVAVSEDDSFDDQDEPVTEAKDEEPKDDEESEKDTDEEPKDGDSDEDSDEDDESVKEEAGTTTVNVQPTDKPMTDKVTKRNQTK
jgi:hypothetical protein